jgi:hypothetical protein
MTRQQLQQQGFDVAQRSQGDPVLTSTDVYIADTLGLVLYLPLPNACRCYIEIEEYQGALYCEVPAVLVLAGSGSPLYSF